MEEDIQFVVGAKSGAMFDHVAAPRDGVMIVSGELSGIGVGDIPAGGAV